MNIDTAELYNKILNTVALWAVGIKREKISGYIKLKFVKEKKYVALRYNLTLNRVMVKDKYEARGYIKLIVKRSFKISKKLDLNIDDQRKTYSILINMGYYLLASKGRVSSNFIKFLDEIINLRDKSASLILPPFLPDFMKLLESKLMPIKETISEICKEFNPEDVYLSLGITGKKGDVIIGEALGRAIKLLATEYADLSNWRNIERQLKRHGGLEDEIVKEFFQQWEKGLINLLEITINHLNVLTAFKCSLKEGILKGLIDDENEKNHVKYLETYLYLIEKYLGESKLKEVKKIMADEMGLEISESIDGGNFYEIRERILKSFEMAQPCREIVKIGEEIAKEETLRFCEYLTTSPLFDREKVFAAIFLILKAKKLDIKKILSFTNQLVINDETLLGSILNSLKALESDKVETLRHAHHRLAKFVSRFSFSRSMLKYPYSVLVPIAYSILYEIEQKIGLDLKAERSLEVARKISNRAGLGKILLS